MAKQNLGRKGKLREMDALDAPTKDLNWEGQEISVESDTKLSDDKGQGIPVIVRCFEFKANPEAFKKMKPTREMLLSDHKKGIEAWLWKDELVALPQMSPKVVISKKKDGYRIFVTCIPKAGALLIDKPQTLNQITNGTSKQNSK